MQMNNGGYVTDILFFIQSSDQIMEYFRLLYGQNNEIIHMGC